MADPTAAPPMPPRPKTSPMVFLGLGIVFALLFFAELRMAIGRYAGYVLEPVLGFGGRYPVLTILLSGVVLVALSTLVRHFTTDWLEVARIQAVMRHWQREMAKARKENNKYKLKILQDAQPEVMAQQQKLSASQMKLMPLTMVATLPVGVWLWTWLYTLEYPYFAAPWNPAVDMYASNGILFGTSVLPHWALLSFVLTIPLGLLLQRLMKFFAWKERWQKRHPEAHG